MKATLHDTAEQPKKAFLVSVFDNKTPKETAASLAHELKGLADTLELAIVGQEIVHIRENNAKFGMGTGKAAEIAEKAKEIQADCIIFDNMLSPSKQRNWETLTELSVMDRQELIIQIFAQRAQSKEAVLQVELARLEYSLPRLQHKYIDLSRQRGGRYGTKGSGETKLETDRRLVEQRIQRLKRDLEEVRKMRDVRRKKREQDQVPLCSLVGYTNAGKSSLLNTLTNADVFVENKLFATLDATTRRLGLGEGKVVLLTDTVGFIRNLPHTLVDAFRSTLEEAALSNLLVHVLDASDPDIDRYYETTLSVLGDLGADKVPIITVLNKADLVPAETLADLQGRYADSIAVSAKKSVGLAELKKRLEATAI
jgi:GTP-binding protein HflX